MKLLPFQMLCLFVLTFSQFSQAQVSLGADKVKKIIQSMTLEEKLSLISGEGFSTKAIPRVGIPKIEMTDGPIGVTFPTPVIAYPSTISLTATFDKNLMYKYGVAIAEQVKAHGKHVILGPCVNLARYPLSGRVFECTSEDPVVAGVFAKEYISGVQSQNIMSTVKHFAANDQEYHRTESDSRVSERALREVHLFPFEEAIKAGAGAIMAGYNSVNGSFNTQNKKLLVDILKNDWGFSGIRMSDWWASKDAVASAKNGLDLEMPYGYLNHKDLEPLFQKCAKDLSQCDVPAVLIDEKVERILTTFDRFGFLDPKAHLRDPDKFDPTVFKRQDHINLSLDVARDSFVLLKNADHLLPIDVRTKSLKKISFFGSAAAFARTSGGGSGYVHTGNQIQSPLEAMKQRLKEMKKEDVLVDYAVGEVYGPSMSPAPVKYMYHKEASGNLAPGLVGEYYDNEKLSGDPKLTRVEKEIGFDWWQAPHGSTDYFSVKYSGYLKVQRDGEHEFVFTHDDGMIVELDGKEIVNNWTYDDKVGTRISRFKTNLKANKAYSFVIKYYEHFAWARVYFSLRTPGVDGRLPSLVNEAVQLASDSDVAVVFAGFNHFIETEDVDRADMSLPEDQDKLIKAVSSANPNTVVVIYAGSIVDTTPWRDQVKSILYAWYPGEVVGLATADILLGLANPSAKLPLTLPQKWEDSPAYTPTPVKNNVIDYNEGILIGYRWFDTKAITPAFPFGFGLSYTEFSIADLKVDVLNDSVKDPLVNIKVNVTNTGSVAGKEVVQVYISDLYPMIEKSAQELKAFEKVTLAPGETRQISMDLNIRSFAYWDSQNHAWKVDPSQYLIKVGNSSRDVQQAYRLVLK